MAYVIDSLKILILASVSLLSLFWKFVQTNFGMFQLQFLTLKVLPLNSAFLYSYDGCNEN